MGIRIVPCELPQPLNRRIRTLSPMSEPTRCPWSTNDPLYLDYHDKEWGTPNRDGRLLFEKVILEGAQAGLSWIQILRRRENYRAAFDGFDPAKVAAYDDNDIERLVTDAGIIRNRAKPSTMLAPSSSTSGPMRAPSPTSSGPSSMGSQSSITGSEWRTSPSRQSRALR